MYACSEASPTIFGCTFQGNSSGQGGGLACGFNSFPVLHQTIIAESREGSAVYCIECAVPYISCCDIYGNAGGDWVDCIASMAGTNGNICEDPLFCDGNGYDFRLECASPCVDGYGCGQIGALGVGCGASLVEPTTWSSLKARYRE